MTEHMERFFSHTKKIGDCLIWIGATNGTYGQTSIGYKKIVAHRMAYEFKHGPIIDKKLVVRHLCHNKLCVKVEHLALGTEVENSIDTVLSQNNINAKLNQESIMMILQLFAEGFTCKEIAQEFNLSHSTISYLLTGKSWSYITGIPKPIKKRHIEKNYKQILYSKTEKVDECLIWQGRQNDHGYGEISFYGKPKKAHRIAYELEYGEIPSGYVIRHLCHNKLCVNIKHLACGTEQENARDTALSNNAPSASLTIEQVRTIKQMLKNNISIGFIATQFNVGYGCIHNIYSGATWSYVD